MAKRTGLLMVMLKDWYLEMMKDLNLVKKMVKWKEKQTAMYLAKLMG
jgi:hypothetical protein